jgi:hypothetical protein
MKCLGRTLSLVVFVCLLVAAPAGAAKKAPSVTSFSPRTAAVGEKMVVRGKNFLPGTKSRVYFLGSGGSFGFAQAEAGTKRRLVVTVPDLTEHLRRSGSGFLPTRFKLRVLGKKLGKATSLRRSPLIVAAGDGSGGGGAPGPTNIPDGDCDGDGFRNSAETDDDNDLLLDDTEDSLTKTDPCKPDTDGDSIEDGYEFNSALDLNNNPAYVLPYPGKRPYPNPLDSTDAPRDYDGDGLTMTDEYRLFITYGGHALPLNYSDGTQTTQPESKSDYIARNPAGIDPALLDYYIDMEGNGTLSDDEKDADGDGLSNWDESHGRMTQDWWDEVYNGSGGFDKETRYPLDYAPVDLADPDSDGDGQKDGPDDQDHDGLSNAFELKRPRATDPNSTGDWWVTYIAVGHPGTSHWSRTQPYNPCKPRFSDTCHRHPPFGYYGDSEPWEPVYPPPALSSAPATPR